ncbi:TrmH family RNA methyltransferase [Candidatus Saccharibacteria bacterium]|nr:TrmH family RNA methyltransferase [Candidatus Saccharibacteria bacterium]
MLPSCNYLYHYCNIDGKIKHMRSEITLVLHNIRSTHNVGSIFRTAEGFGVQKIILSGYTPYPTIPNDSRLPHIAEKLTTQIHKTALGAEKLVEFEYIDNIYSWLDNYSHPVVALEQSNESTLLPRYHPPAKFALVLGEEVHGIPPDILTRCSETIEIPMFGQKESFNVSVATGIALYGLLVNQLD